MFKRARSTLADKANRSVFNPEFISVKRYVPLTLGHTFACHGVARESIVLDTRSAELDKTFQQFLTSLYNETAATQPLDEAEETKSEPDYSILKAKSITDIFPSLFVFIKSLLKPTTEGNIESEILAHYAEQQKARLPGKNLEISLEFFVRNQIGFCRHDALLTAYLLAKFNDFVDAKTDCDIFRFRTTFESTGGPVAHAVVILNMKNNRYLIDSTNSVAVDISNLTANDLGLLHARYAQYDVGKFINEINDTYDLEPQLRRARTLSR